MNAEKNYWRKAVSRRRALQGAAIGGAGLATAALIGCGRQAEPAPTTTTTETTTQVQAKRGGTLNHRMASEFLWAGYDPHVGNQAQGSSMALFYQTLLGRNARTVESEPLLAQRWEQPSPTEYLFRLAPGVKWHNRAPVNGRELTAEDVVFSLNRARTDEPRFLNKLLLSSVDRAQAVDKSTVRVTTKTPDVTLLANLSDDTMAILAPEAVEKAGRFATADTVVGTGAFIFQSADDVTANAVRNPDYWKPGLPYLDGVRVQRVVDTQSAFASFLGGGLHVIQVPGAEVKRITQEGDKYQTGWWKDQAPQVLWINTRKAPFNDPRVYRALRLLMDHTEMISGWVEAWFGPGSGVHTSHLPHLLDAWDFPQDDYKQARTPLFLEWKQPKDDAAREALSLLSAAGYNRDRPLRFLHQGTTGTWQPAVTQLMQDQWRRMGQGVVQSELKLEENTALYALQIQGEFEVAGPLGRASMYEPDQAFSYVYHSKGGQNFGKYSDPQLDQMIDRQRTLFDAAQRKAAIREIMTYLLQNAPYTSPCSRDLFWAAQSRVKDFSPEPIFLWGPQYEKVWLDA
jgi:peptide/nickel transport system substrate-binding protein